jgi:uncharacterized protein YceK
MKKIVVVIMLSLMLAGCSSYYKVTDPTTEKVYYTNSVNYNRSGSVKIKDAKTGAAVTLPASEVQKIEKEEFSRGIYSGN